MKKLFLIDGMAIAYRAYFALMRSPIFNSKGLNTSAAYGFTSTIIDLIQKQKPTHFAIAFDTSSPTERHEIFPEYKANREAMPEDLSISLPYIELIADGFNIPILKLDGYEADDIIGTIAKNAEKEKFNEIYMVTPDKDFGQLVTNNIYIYNPSKKGNSPEILGIKEVQEKWDVKDPLQIIDMLGLCGDASDNIPGVRGIGPKTGSKLLNEFGSIENILDKVGTLSGKVKEHIENNKTNAILSKKLATINKSVPINYDFDDFLIKEPSYEKLYPIFSELEFRTIGRRVFGKDFEINNDINPKPQDEQIDLIVLPKLKSLKDVNADYKIINNESEKKELIEEINNKKIFSFDTETDSLNTQKANLKGIAFVTDINKGWYLPYSRKDLPFIKTIFEDKSSTKIGHNLKYDISILKNHDCQLYGDYYDTLIAHSLIDPTQRHNLDFLAETIFKYKTITFSEIYNEDKKSEFINYEKIDLNKLSNYAIEDADITLQLWNFLKPKLEKLEQSNIFYSIEMPLLKILIEMEYEGIKICKKTLKETGNEISIIIDKLKKDIFNITGEEFNLNSPKQLGVILFEKLKIIEKPKKTKTGQYATNEQILTTLAKSHKIVSDILEYRQLTKLISTYIDALPNSINKETKRIHTNFGQVQTATGRLTSNAPNLQNIPIKSSYGKKIRKAFIPRKENWMILSADYSQIELRILASLSNDPSMIEAFIKKEDIHASTAAKIFNINQNQITREQRNTAKMVNFGIPYGISAFGLSQRLGNVNRNEAQDIIDNYFNQFPTIHEYIEKQINFAKKNGFVTTLNGRRRYLNDINSSNANVRNAAERNAINMPIQGTAADLIKIAMIEINKNIESKKLHSKMLLQVHDELVFDLLPAEEQKLKDILRKEMVNAIKLSCPIDIEIGVGLNWLEAH